MQSVQYILEKLDIFGLSISFRVYQQKYHKTLFGGIVTLIIWTVIIYQLVTLTKYVYNQDSPIIIQQTNYVSQQEEFEFKPNTFTFAFGLQDPLSQHFKDESYYIIKASMVMNERLLNQTTGVFDLKTRLVEVKIVNCTKQHFQIEGTQEYFYKLPLDKLYCFNLQEPFLGIQGEFSAQYFKQFNIQIHECTADTCASPELRAKKLARTRLGIYTSDNLIQVTNRDKPYMSIGRNMFWVTGSGLEKEIRFQLINNYIYTDLGIMKSDIKVDRVVSFSSDRELVLNRQSSIMYNFFFNYEKNKEIVYQRKYMKLDQAFSQVGGIFNVLISVGYLLCWPISQLEFNRKIINSVFSVDEKEIEESENPKQPNKGKDQIESKHNKQISKLEEKFKKAELQKQLNSQKISESIQKNESLCLSKCQILRQQQQPELNQDQEDNDNYTKNFFYYTYSELRIKFIDYISSYFNFICKRRSAKNRIIQFGTSILNNHIDILNVINKLVEIDKLKHLLLNENQLKLFDYIPKPQLNLSQIDQQSEQNKIFGSKIKKSYTINTPSKISHKNQNNDEAANENDYNLIFTQQKSVQEKAEEAFIAFNNISLQQTSKSEIDKKLIQMIDKKLVSLFQDNRERKISLLNSRRQQDQSVLSNLCGTQELDSKLPTTKNQKQHKKAKSSHCRRYSKDTITNKSEIEDDTNFKNFNTEDEAKEGNSYNIFDYTRNRFLSLSKLQSLTTTAIQQK